MLTDNIVQKLTLVSYLLTLNIQFSENENSVNCCLITDERTVNLQIKLGNNELRQNFFA